MECRHFCFKQQGFQHFEDAQPEHGGAGF